MSTLNTFQATHLVPIYNVLNTGMPKMGFSQRTRRLGPNTWLRTELIAALQCVSVRRASLCARQACHVRFQADSAASAVSVPVSNLSKVSTTYYYRALGSISYKLRFTQFGGGTIA
jgi:hypothetical protein